MAVTFFDSQGQMLGETFGGTVAGQRWRRRVRRRGGGSLPSAHLQARRAHLELPVTDAFVEWMFDAQHEKNELRDEVDVLAVLFEFLADVQRLLQASRHTTYRHDRRHECSQAGEKACK